MPKRTAKSKTHLIGPFRDPSIASFLSRPPLPLKKRTVVPEKSSTPSSDTTPELDTTTIPENFVNNGLLNETPSRGSCWAISFLMATIGRHNRELVHELRLSALVYLLNNEEHVATITESRGIPFMLDDDILDLTSHTAEQLESDGLCKDNGYCDSSGPDCTHDPRMPHSLCCPFHDLIR